MPPKKRPLPDVYVCRRSVRACCLRPSISRSKKTHQLKLKEETFMSNKHSLKTIHNQTENNTCLGKQGATLQLRAKPATRMVQVGTLILLFIISLAMSATAQNILAQVAVPSNDCCQVPVNSALNKVY